MSNETHSEAHHEDHGQTERAKSKTSFQSSFWFVIIRVGLFIAALNFVSASSHDKGEAAEKAEIKAESPAQVQTENDKARLDTANVKHGKDADTIKAEQHL